jgi:hypothetical protein
MKLQELNIQELENRFEMSVIMEEPSIDGGPDPDLPSGHMNF